MTKRTDVHFALIDLCRIALPGARVLGLDGDAEAPGRVPPTGQVIVRSGDPGDPEVTLSPRTYWYDHRYPLEIAGYQSGGLTGEEIIADMLSAIGEAIEADRTLRGLCEWMEAEAPLTEDIYVQGGATPRGANVVIVATYGTRDPLA